jgi:hypothetical protein
MIRFYFHPTPNPAKVGLLLEEAGIGYETIPVDTSKGEQHTRDFRAISVGLKVSHGTPSASSDVLRAGSRWPCIRCAGRRTRPRRARLAAAEPV